MNRPPSLIFAVLLLAPELFGQALPTAPESPSGWTPKQAVVSRHDMVAAAKPLAVDAGYRILKAGGSAVDAAIAVQMVLNLVEAQSSGIGGGAFMLYHDTRVIDHTSGLQAIVRTPRGWIAGADPRREGTAKGS